MCKGLEVGKKFSALVEQQEAWSIVSEGTWEREGGGREGKVAGCGVLPDACRRKFGFYSNAVRSP